MFMLLVALSGFYLIILFRLRKNNKVMAFILISLTVTIGIFFSVYSQFLGSNQGLLLNFLISVILFFHYYGLPDGELNGYVKVTLLRYFKLYFVGIFKSLWLILIISIVGVFSFRDSLLSKSRFFGFETDQTNSIKTRYQNVMEVFINQIDHGVIFGNTRVDFLLDAAGSYSHNILSIITHLGFVGLILYLLIILNTVLIFSRKRENIKLFYFNGFSFPIFLMVFLFSLLFTFYTWMPLWFSIVYFSYLNLRLKETIDV